MGIACTKPEHSSSISPSETTNCWHCHNPALLCDRIYDVLVDEFYHKNCIQYRYHTIEYDYILTQIEIDLKFLDKNIYKINPIYTADCVTLIIRMPNRKWKLKFRLDNNELVDPYISCKIYDMGFNDQPEVIFTSDLYWQLVELVISHLTKRFGVPMRRRSNEFVSHINNRPKFDIHPLIRYDRKIIAKK